MTESPSLLNRRIGRYVITRYLTSGEAGDLRLYEARCDLCGQKAAIEMAAGKFRRFARRPKCYHEDREGIEQRKALLFACAW